MSLVVAVKDKDRVVLGSDKQASTSFNKEHSATKIWEVVDLPGAIMGSVGSMRASQIIQYSRIINLNDLFDKGGISTGYIINSLVPAIVAQLQAAGMPLTASEDKDMPCAMIPNVFIFAFEDKAWMIWNDLSVSEIDEYLVIGSGSEVATGVLFATKEKNPFERIITCIDAASETTLFVDDGVDLLATKYKPKDRQQIAKALGIKLVTETVDNGVEHVEANKKETLASKTPAKKAEKKPKAKTKTEVKKKSKEKK